MSEQLRPDLLRLLCAELPRSEADMIETMSPDDVMSYVEAFSAAKRAGVEIPSDLRRALAAAMHEYSESDVIDAAETAADPGSGPVAGSGESLAALVRRVVSG
jgi:hypothetical protein